MVYGIFSDIHANLEALEAVLSRLDALGARRLICLGDVVGYGASPNECIARVRESCEVVVPGNHDYAAIQRTSTEFFNSYAREAVLWTRRTLTPDHLAWLEGLPLSATFGTGGPYRAVHATPCLPDKWDYILDVQDARLQFACFEEQACFVGHSHQPVLVACGRDGRVSLERLDESALAADRRYLVNVGSVGQPRDGDPRAAALLLETAEGGSGDAVTTIRIVREPYDVERAQRKILEADLPAVLAARLAVGQ